jgi:5-methylcytosine-specific restriction endonuclease McrA
MIPSIVPHRPRPRDTRARRVLYDGAWAKASKAYINEYPICVLCAAEGRINVNALADTVTRQRSLVVDHIEPHRNDRALFWNQDNWQTLCRLCHDIEKRKHEDMGKSSSEWKQMIRSERAHCKDDGLDSYLPKWARG